jgi:hypothetical protein
VWRKRRFLALGLAVFAGLMVIGFFGANSGHFGPGAVCGEHYHPITIGSCAVPTGTVINICAIVTAGLSSCPINEPDLNPADWLGWFACTIGQETSLIWSAVVGDVESYVTAFAAGVANGLVEAFETPFETLLNAVSSAVTGVIQEFGSVVNLFFVDVNGIAAPLGPLAPVLTVTATLAIFTVASVGLYFAIIFLVAFGKTLFNLL